MSANRADAAGQLLAEALRLQRLLDATHAGLARELTPTMALIDLARHSARSLVTGLERLVQP